MRLTVKTGFHGVSVLCLLLALFSSCSIVRNYPSAPFVYDNKVTVTGNISKDEKNRLTTELDNYWDDSAKAKKIQQFAVVYKLKNPPIFDSANVSRSINYMDAYLNSQGYYYALFNDSIRIDTVNDQQRVSIGMSIDVGKNITIDSVSYNLGDTTLQRLTAQAQKETGGFDIIIDSAGGDQFNKFIELALPGGRIVNFGRTAGNITDVATRQLYWKQLSIHGTTMGTRDEFLSMLDFIESRKLKPVIDQVYPLAQAPEAIKRLEQGGQFGKIVLKIGS